MKEYLELGRINYTITEMSLVGFFFFFKLAGVLFSLRLN